jgi:uncharacterized membrane protein
MTIALPLMLLSYPLLSHWFIRQNEPQYAVYLLGVWVGVFALGSILRRGKLQTTAVIALLLAMMLMLLPGWQGLNLLQLMPVLMNLLLAVLLAFSLGKGQQPLITRLASVMRGGDMPVRVARYTRQVTLVWSLFFAAMAIVALMLTMFATLESWSLFVNFLTYVFIAVLVVGEFVFRRWYLGKLVDYSFTDFIRGLVQLDYAHLFRHK